MSRCRWGLSGFGLRLEDRWSAVGEVTGAGSAGGACFLPRQPVPLVSAGSDEASRARLG